MQQTETLKLNLIETGDPISPVPLNENAEKIEAALAAKADAADHSALETRVTVLEGFHFACGSFSATMEPNIIELGFTPKAVYTYRQMTEYTDAHILITGDTTANMYLRIIENGFRYAANNGYMMYGGIYHYIAFG